MDFDEVSNFIGHHYAALVISQHLHHIFEGTFHSEDAMGEPFSPRTQQRIQERTQLLLNDGRKQFVSDLISSRASHDTPHNVHSPEKMNSVCRTQYSTVAVAATAPAFPSAQSLAVPAREFNPDLSQALAAPTTTVATTAHTPP